MGDLLLWAMKQGIERTTRHTAEYPRRTRRLCKNRQDVVELRWGQQGSAPGRGNTQSISSGPRARTLARTCYVTQLASDQT